MPTYDYRCEKCGHFFEIFQTMKEDKLTKCPECGEEALKRLIGTGSGLIFKGSGFYLTDYKNKPSESTASVTSKKESSESTGNNTSGEKPDSKKVTTESSKTNSETVSKSKDSSGKSSEKKSTPDKS